jgi:nucleotidyltransferase substrate binding protein (TIGR01987 family)
MSAERLESSLRNLGRALDRLEEALALPHHDDLRIDGTIQRFEFTLELLWKTLKRGLEERGVIVEPTPADVIGAAWRSDWLDDDEDAWIGMVKDRNRTSHLYSEAMALEVYERIRVYAPMIRRAHDDLCRRFGIPGRKPGASEAREKGPRYRKTRKPAGKSTTSPRGRSKGTTTTTTTTTRARARGKR